MSVNETIVPVELSRAVEGPRAQHPDTDYPCAYDHTGNILDINKVLVQRLELRSLLADNELLRKHAAKEISDATMLTGLSMTNGGINMGFEGGAAGLLVESFVHQFKNSGGINYVELMFTSTEVMPGERFTVTLQRVNGLTPTQKLAAAEAELKALRESPAIIWPKEKRVGRREDMSPDGTLIVGLDNDNDVYIEVSGNRHGQWQSAAVEFCNGGGGGGQSSRTRAALINLMTAIEADNAESPHKAFPPIAQASSQGGAT